MNSLKRAIFQYYKNYWLLSLLYFSVTIPSITSHSSFSWQHPSTLRPLTFSLASPLQLTVSKQVKSLLVISMANAGSLPSVTLSPDIVHTQKDEIPVSSDRNFAIHGQITMLVLLLLFPLCLLFILYCMCAKRLRDASKVRQPELVSSRNVSGSPDFKGQIRDGYLMHQSVEHKTTQQPV